MPSQPSQRLPSRDSRPLTPRASACLRSPSRPAGPVLGSPWCRLGADTAPQTEVVGESHTRRHAFAALAEDHCTRHWSICLGITGNHFDADDAPQDVLTAVRSEAQFSK